MNRKKVSEGIGHDVYICHLCEGSERMKEYLTMNDLHNHLTERHPKEEKFIGWVPEGKNGVSNE